jgi:uncharacterized damage-inducible protein DinB
MKREILTIAGHMEEVFAGDPWFGRNATSLLEEIPGDFALERPGGQHSMADLLWHMINWKEFAVNRLRKDEERSLADFENDDWRLPSIPEKELWGRGIVKLFQVHQDLISAVHAQDDELLDETVEGRQYDFRKLLWGVIEHDIYHLGQIAFMVKLLRVKPQQQ